MIVINQIKAIIIAIIKLIVTLIKRMVCHHVYELSSKMYGHNTTHDKEVVFNTTYKCTRCGKELFIQMDVDSQLN